MTSKSLPGLLRHRVTHALPIHLQLEHNDSAPVRDTACIEDLQPAQAQIKLDAMVALAFREALPNFEHNGSAPVRHAVRDVIQTTAVFLAKDHLRLDVPRYTGALREQRLGARAPRSTRWNTDGGCIDGLQITSGLTFREELAHFKRND